MTPQQVQPITPGAALLATLCAALWGATAVAIHFAQDDLPPLGTAGLRFALANLFLLAWARSSGEPLWPRAGQWRPVVVLGVLLFFQIGLFHWGMTQTNSAHASILIGSHPVFVAVLAHFLLAGDRLSWGKGAGLGLAVAGLLLVFAGPDDRGEVSPGRDPTTWLGDVVLLVSSILLGIKTVYTKQALAATEPIKLLLWSNTLAVAGFLACSLWLEGPARYRFTTSAVLALLYQGLVVAGFCFAAWTALLRRHRASQLAVFAFVQPLCGIVFGVWLRDDPLTWSLALGGLGVAAGIYLVTRADGAAAEQKP